MTASPSARLSFCTCTAHDTALAQALRCDAGVTHFFSGPVTPGQPEAQACQPRRRVH